jgi:hypothetical protein
MAKRSKKKSAKCETLLYSRYEFDPHRLLCSVHRYGPSGFPNRSGFPGRLNFLFVPAFRSFRLSGRSGFPVVPAFRLFQLSIRSDFSMFTEQKNALKRPRIACLLKNRRFILLLQSETEIDFSYKNGMFKWQINQDRRGPRHNFLTSAIFTTTLSSRNKLPLNSVYFFLSFSSFFFFVFLFLLKYIFLIHPVLPSFIHSHFSLPFFQISKESFPMMARPGAH